MNSLKNILLCACLMMVCQVVDAQNSFANIYFDGPERYIPEGKQKIKTAREFRMMKERIRAFPSRLDYRYDYLHELTIAKDWDRLTDEVIALVNYSYNTDHNWSWDKRYDAIGDQPESFILNTVQDYVFMLYVTDDKVQYAFIDKICEEVLRHKPDHREFLTYPAMTSAAVGDYDRALTFLHKAEHVHREDGMVAMLLAENYQKLKNDNLALSYYKKAARYGNDREVMLAKKQIQILEDKE